ncbi:hypothetical protein N7452_000442 [Penicillium brevicompactum]|uniref:Uncharacterized protein n=1 Tax=Penicillium brevicompactum TaxID=5074 RepID=A0A9W9R0H0_PENBR|nr:hypothetical protein N7452_000442 [Penicillium brevicompactum]
MSPMKLRETIRVPVRYGETDFDMKDQGSLRPGDGEADDEDWTEPGVSARPRSHKRHNPNTVPYNPNLPPAAFPSINIPHAGPAPNTPELQSRVQSRSKRKRARENGTESRPVTLPIRGADASDTSSMSPSESEGVPMDQLENHIASNNMDNPTYARNVRFARNAPSSSEDLTTRLDSDDELPDATQVLLEKIPNPEWKDVHPAIQVELFENMMDDYNHYALLRVLGIGKQEYDKLMEFRLIRNKQILRENERLEVMRAKQRNALMAIDNSDLKMFVPPPHLVLKRIARETNKSLIKKSKHTDLMMCQSHDLLKARHLVVMQESEEDGPDPDKFEWNEELNFTPPTPPRDPAQEQTHQDNLRFVNSFGRGFVDPSVLVKRGTDQEPVVDWGKHFERRNGDSFDTQRPRSKIVKLKIGRENAATIWHYERTGIMPRRVGTHGPLRQVLVSQTAVPGGHTSQFVMPRVTMPPVAMTQGSMMRFAMPHSAVVEGTLPRFAAPSGLVPSGNTVQGMGRLFSSSSEFDPLSNMLPPPRRVVFQTDARQGAMPSEFSPIGYANGSVIRRYIPSPVNQQPARPISRRIDTEYRPQNMDYAQSHARYRRHLMRAHQEYLEKLTDIQRGRQMYQMPTVQGSSVAARGLLSQGVIQNPSKEGSGPRSQGTFSWDEHEKSMSGPHEELMKEVIHPETPIDNAKNAE